MIPNTDKLADALRLIERMRDAIKNLDHHGVYAHELRDADASLAAPPACPTCNDRGEVGGHVGQTPENFDYVTEPCPDCAPPAQGEWVLVPRVPPNEMLCAAGTMNNYDIDAGGRADDDHVAWWEAMLAAAPQPAPAPVQVDGLQWLFVAMDDDGARHLTWCSSREDIREAVWRACFDEGAKLLPEHVIEIDGNTDLLIEDGAVSFEGDHGLRLIRLARSDAAQPPAPRKAGSLIGLRQSDPTILAADIDQRVPMAAARTQEVAAGHVNLGLDGSEHDEQAAASTGPHGRQCTPGEAELPPLPKWDDVLKGRYLYTAMGHDRMMHVETYAKAYARAAIAALRQQVPDAVREEVSRVAQHIAMAVEYIDKQYPDARMLDRAPIMSNLRRWAKRLESALATIDAQQEARGND